MICQLRSSVKIAGLCRVANEIKSKIKILNFFYTAT